MSSDRGWNDPPSFAFSSTGQAPKKVLSRRLVHETKTETKTDVANLENGPPIGPPPIINKQQIKETPSRADEEVDTSQSLNELDTLWQKSIDSIPKKFRADIERRLNLLKNDWESERLSMDVKQRMAKLIRGLACGDYDSAYRIHVSLMVDSVTEVSQWMVGIKRIISTLQQNPIAPDTDTKLDEK
ncbi:steroid receptor RNA activator 1-like [Oscarella lobularis]|uniref:steroid receptor RNA activator 1-like n=1 Tax=Oscarella lobularis TaxID=121494 RepID=UPI0033139E2D